jgi:arsenate reductase
VEKTGVLILCTGNSCRSQIAEAFLRRHGGDRFEVRSAGSEPAPAIHPLTYKVMSERGFELAEHSPKDYRDILDAIPLDYVIVVCDGAARSCPAIWPGGAERLLWPFDDPAAFEGSEEQRTAGFRRVRDEIEARIVDWLAALRDTHSDGR